MKPLIVPIFIPNAGCPHLCLFCDQRHITGAGPHRVTASRIRQVLDAALSSASFRAERRPQVAFYGGSFTGLPLSRMKELLVPWPHMSNRDHFIPFGCPPVRTP